MVDRNYGSLKQEQERDAGDSCIIATRCSNITSDQHQLSFLTGSSLSGSSPQIRAAAPSRDPWPSATLSNRRCTQSKHLSHVCCSVMSLRYPESVTICKSESSILYDDNNPFSFCSLVASPWQSLTSSVRIDSSL